MKKSSLKSVHQFLNDLLITQCSIFSHKQYFHQCFYVIECKLYKSKHLKCKKKPPENVFKYHNYIITGDLHTINKCSLRNNFCKDQNSVRKQSVDLNRAKSYILSGLEDCANNTCSKHDIHKSMFPEWANKVKEKITTRIDILNNTLHKHKHEDSLNSPDSKKALESNHNSFVVVLIHKAALNIAVISKQFYGSVIAKC